VDDAPELRVVCFPRSPPSGEKEYAQKSTKNASKTEPGQAPGVSAVTGGRVAQSADEITRQREVILDFADLTK
jgi:hypothetical protein